MSDDPSSTRAGQMRWNVADSKDLVVVRTEGSFNLADHHAMIRDVVADLSGSPVGIPFSITAPSDSRGWVTT